MIAIATGMLHQVRLMFLFRDVKGIGPTNLGLHLASDIGNLTSRHGLLQFGLDLSCNGNLFITVAKNPTGILRPRIISLAILGRRIWTNKKGKPEENVRTKQTLATWYVAASRTMKHEKELNQFFEMRFRIIEFNIEHLNMPRYPTAHVFVAWVLDCIGVGTHESDLGILDTIGISSLKVLNNILLSSPKATWSAYYSRPRWGSEGRVAFGQKTRHPFRSSVLTCAKSDLM
mmetsp:Transcript_827/g.2001  ORF Transcript_827/g.2001 Transcript_827/m.2001 type:complete len:231 (-) Transcript_827:44-736(-)